MTPKDRLDIVPMRAEHVPQMARIEESCFSAPWSEAALREELENPLARVLVCEQAGEVLGYAGLRLILDEGYITNVAVRADCRRRGIGLALMEGLIRHGRAEGLRFMTLEVRESNRGAQELYRRCGFTLAGRRRRYYTDPEEDALLMSLVFSEKEDTYDCSGH